jgi:hypothetical protein
MQFKITAGAKKGQTFKLVDEPISLGRRKDNLIALDDESVSGHHARIYFEGGDAVIEDCDSVNGVEVNGEKVSTKVILPGDVITIGAIKIQCGDDREFAAASSMRMSKSGRGKAAAGGKASAGKSRMIIAAVLLLAVVGVAAAMFFPQLGLMPRKAGTRTPGFSDKIFRLYYEKVQASASNIFRYELKIENAGLSVAVNDLKESRNFQKTTSLTAVDIAQLESAIHDQQVFSLDQKIEGSSKDAHDSVTLHVVSKGKVHEVQVINRLAPDNLKRVLSTLENMVENKIGIESIPRSSDELKKRAADAVIRGRKLYDERFVKVDNLFNAIKSFSEAIWYLDTIDPKPKTFGEAVHWKEVATEELNKQIDDHTFNAVRSIQLKEWPKAKEELLMILQKLPDTNDRRYEDAQRKLLDVEKRLLIK